MEMQPLPITRYSLTSAHRTFNPHAGTSGTYLIDHIGMKGLANEQIFFSRKLGVHDGSRIYAMHWISKPVYQPPEWNAFTEWQTKKLYTTHSRMALSLTTLKTIITEMRLQKSWSITYFNNFKLDSRVSMWSLYINYKTDIHTLNIV